jgi:hypothetical protein
MANGSTRVGKWKIARTHEPAGDYQYKVARIVSDDDGPSHVEDYQYCDTREAGHDWPQAHPGITKVLSGISRKHGETVKRMAPLEIADLKKCLEVHKHWPPEIVIRDRALLSLGFFAAL